MVWGCLGWLFTTTVACSAPTPPALGGALDRGPALYEDEDISGAALHDGALYVVSDEGNVLLRLSPVDGGWARDAAWTLPDLTPTTDRRASDDAPELDLEAVSPAPGGVVVIGSHGARRKTVADDRSYAKNWKRLATVDAEPRRRFAAHVVFDGGTPTLAAQWDFGTSLQDHPLIGRFMGLPSKENGVDIEGVAVVDGWLYLGLRGPVLRGGWAVVLSTPLDMAPALTTTATLPLDGLGIRDLAAVDGGFLVLGGPMGDGPGDHPIWFWSGTDCMVGEGAPGCTLTQVATLPTRSDARAEALAVLAADGGGWQVLVAWDGVTGGAGELKRVPKP
ncbi:MAG: hypothetical protein ACI8PZ_002011 [Myxococcota bacterium]|jgi:hypothetical protein